MSTGSTQGIGLYEAIHTARSLRRFKPEPVPEPLLRQILDAAIRAPSAGNAQNWAFIVVQDAHRRAALGEIYKKASRIADAMYAARGRPAHLTEGQFRSMMSSGSYLWEHMADAPVILIPCLSQPIVPAPEALPEAMRIHHPAELVYAQRIRGASIYPAVQNILLTCRALGLGTTITTNHIRCEQDVRALLELPDNYDTFAMMPIGWPIDAFGPLTRRPLSEIVHMEGWGRLWST